MSLPTTPERRAEIGHTERHGSPTQLHSILRRPGEHDRQSPTTPELQPPLQERKSLSPKSQVRFSIPDSSYLKYDHSVDDGSPTIASPSKIVFPKDAEQLEDDGSSAISHNMTNRGHFVDMQSGVMLDVPEEIWNFHTTRRGRGSRHQRSRSLLTNTEKPRSHKSHNRRSSLQAVIVETVKSMYDEHRSRLAPSSLGRPELFLSPESPLNNYKMPVPLEISLPPYLSPVNKEKKRSSVIFDGEGYSQFEGLHSSSSDDSEVSLRSAEHDVSFNISLRDDSDVDRALGIDEHANVDLKVQKKNLRKQEVPSQPSLDKQSNNSLQVLSTPYKPICIPDLEKEVQPRSTNGTLKFFDEFVPSQNSVAPTQEEEQLISPGKQVDQLDLNFTFPNVPDSDFQKIDPSVTSIEFENRRKSMQRDSALGNKGHRHRRSRSIHNAEDMFAATSTPPKIPSRSPLRPKSPKSEEVVEFSKEAEAKETSSQYEDSDQSVALSSQNVGEVSHQSDLKAGNQTDESMRIISERKINTNDERETNPDRDATQMHLTSMHSFREPVHPPDDTQIQSFDSLPVNLLSPRRSLSNVGSQSSHNSVFSRRSPGSTATSQPSESYAFVPFLSSGEGQNPSNYTKASKKGTIRRDQPENHGFHSIYEVRDGQKVEVLVLDDDTSQDETFKTSADRVDNSLLTQKRMSISYEEAIKKYDEIVQMCEHTASEARNVILQLIQQPSPNHRNGYRPSPPSPLHDLRVSDSEEWGRPLQSKKPMLKQRIENQGLGEEQARVSTLGSKYTVTDQPKVL